MRSLLTERAAPGGRASHLQPAPRPTAQRWELLLDPRGASGAVNMAIDAGLLALATHTGRAFLRLYHFDPPCLSFGRNEPARGYDRAAIARLGVDVVRRPTGGRVVWHEHEVTYAVAAPVAAVEEMFVPSWSEETMSRLDWAAAPKSITFW